MTDTRTDTPAEDAPPGRADQARAALLEPALQDAAFDGWTSRTLSRAAHAAGMSEGEAELYYPGGVLDLIEFWSARADAAAETKIRENGANRIRDRIANAVMIRLEEYAGHEEAAARARARLLLPDAADRSAGLVWNTVDMIWRAIGDTSTDGNFYSKRAVLSAVYLSTLTIWMGENDPAKPRTRAFLDRRIENVMQFEKTKAQARKAAKNLPDLVGLAARLRHGPGRRA